MINRNEHNLNLGTENNKKKILFLISLQIFADVKTFIENVMPVFPSSHFTFKYLLTFSILCVCYNQDTV